MSFRRAVKLACGFAGGSAVVVACAYFTDKHREIVRLKPGLSGVLHAAQPSANNTNHWDYNWDKREPSSMSSSRRRGSVGEENGVEVENNKPTATRHIFLIRHSQYNLSGGSDSDRTLTPLGREQAELTGQRLASLGLKYHILVHSSMARATETAQIISTHLPGVEMVSCDLLREGAPIEPVPPVTHWKPEAVYHEDGARIEAAFRRYIHRADPKQKEDSYEIVVCHANVIRYFVCRALQFPPEGWLRLGLNNGSITWLTVRPSGRVALRALGDSGFMPPDKVTRT
ncbi:serine/threonine-protein phosphatase PGAM5, mitochondrial isoform X2 [Hemibagrus wyckioides]|uniref:serine/threonine-protein phosphatase PGAM5, mitochondrial isoform X2 n=1 Tax=Hemibagrus wyckioides TaxID=337641 RepID=UPI00266CD096|nr:serine/threonine-protein phosphatase PGAM5, mitochondrial isoform X2 [Hemibagrus wyckioides]